MTGMTDALLERLRQSPVVGRYFTPDGQLVEVSGGSDDGASSGGSEGAGSGEGGDGAGSGQGSNSGESGAGDQNGGGEGEGGEETKLTPEQQAIVDAQVTKQVGAAMAKKIEAERKKWEADAKTAAEREKMEETERLKAEKADADKAVETAKREVLTTRVEVTAERLALKADVDPDRVTRFIQLANIDDKIDDLVADDKPDDKAVGKLIDATLKEWPEFKKANGKGSGRSGGEFNGNNGDTKPATLEDAVSARYA
jgi:hypothetical protein